MNELKFFWHLRFHLWSFRQELFLIINASNDFSKLVNFQKKITLKKIQID